MKKLLMLSAAIAVVVAGTAFAGDTLVPGSYMGGDNHDSRCNPGYYDGGHGDSDHHGSGGGSDSDSDNPGNSDKNTNSDAGYECESNMAAWGPEYTCGILPRCCE